LEGRGKDNGVEGLFVCEYCTGDGVGSAGLDGVLGLGFRDRGYSGVKEGGGVRGVEHSREDLPVTAFYLHCSFDGHADHCFETVDKVEVLAIVDSGACLDNIGCERGTNLRGSAAI